LSESEKKYREARNALCQNLPFVAEELATILTKEEPNSEKILILKGDIAFKKNLQDEAIEFYAKAKEINPKSSISPHKMAQVLIKKGKNDVAAALLDIAAELNPYHIKLLENAGISHYNIKNYEKAETYSYKLKKIDKENRSAGEISAKSKIARGDYGGIVNALRDSHDEQELVTFLNNAGVKLAKGNDVLGALKMYEACLSSLKDSPFLFAVYFNIGIAYRKLGSNEKAYENFEKSLKLKPDFQKCREALIKVTADFEFKNDFLG
ncbi:MAG: tetratricopeptide repeat protein, partial [Silvanigrellaceae bacterium]|nr:tetratricopeptide repeat protein [Silvanigrellaceae bacterium]